MAHCHIKDVAADLAESSLGEETGIATSEVPLGGGVNADNIRKCVDYLKATGWSGVLSIECSGTDRNIRKSVAFLRELLA